MNGTSGVTSDLQCSYDSKLNLQIWKPRVWNRQSVSRRGRKNFSRNTIYHALRAKKWHIFVKYILTRMDAPNVWQIDTSR